MQSRVLIGFCGVVLVLVLWNTWSVSRLDARLSGWEQTATGPISSEWPVEQADPGGQLAPLVRGEKPERSLAMDLEANDPSTEAAALDLENPEVRDAIAKIVEDNAVQRKETKRKEQVDLYLESMAREVDSFAEEYDLDAQTKAQLMRELEARTYAWTAVKNDVQDGEFSWLDAKEEFRALKEEGETSLRGLLGDEKFEELSGRLWGHRGK
jgi:hypothetical protein